jgi:uncharacterized membrane protein
MATGVLSIPLLNQLTGDWMIAAAIGLVGLATVLSVVGTRIKPGAR